MFSLKSPHRRNSNEYTQYTIYNILKKITQIIPNLQLWDFSQGLKNEYITAMENKPSMFEPLKFYCIYLNVLQHFLDGPGASITFKPNCVDVILASQSINT